MDGDQNNNPMGMPATPASTDPAAPSTPASDQSITAPEPVTEVPAPTPDATVPSATPAAEAPAPGEQQNDGGQNTPVV